MVSNYKFSYTKIKLEEAKYGLELSITENFIDLSQFNKVYS